MTAAVMVPSVVDATWIAALPTSPAKAGAVAARNGGHHCREKAIAQWIAPRGVIGKFEHHARFYK